jgi:tetratricopeptide (TPR) repeat protein
MGITDKLPLLNSNSKGLRLIGYGLYGIIGLFLFLFILGSLVGPEKSSKTTDEWYNEGISTLKQENNVDAIKYFDEAIKLDPNYADAWVGKGIALVGQNKEDEATTAWNKAIEIYDEAIKSDPNNAAAWDNKGVALRLLGRTTEAGAAHAKALELTEEITNTPQVTSEAKTSDDTAWFSSVTNTADLIYEEGDAIAEQFGDPEYDTRQTAIELRQKLQNALDVSEGYRVSSSFETDKDKYEVALKNYIMDLYTLIDAIDTLNVNGYTEGSRAMDKAQTALVHMDLMRSMISEVDSSNIE